MKTLKNFLSESIVNEERFKFKPSFSVREWTKALKELHKGSSGNYSQLRSMEQVLNVMFDTPEEAVESWIEMLYDGGFDPSHKFMEVVKDIANFLANNYSDDGYDYRDESATIWEIKNDKTDCDFGVEEENWYKFYEYNGPSNLTKYAKELAKFGDCSDMDPEDEW